MYYVYVILGRHLDVCWRRSHTLTYVHCVCLDYIDLRPYKLNHIICSLQQHIKTTILCLHSRDVRSAYEILKENVWFTSECICFRVICIWMHKTVCEMRVSCMWVACELHVNCIWCLSDAAYELLMRCILLQMWTMAKLSQTQVHMQSQ